MNCWSFNQFEKNSTDSDSEKEESRVLNSFVEPGAESDYLGRIPISGSRRYNRAFGKR